MWNFSNCPQPAKVIWQIQQQDVLAVSLPSRFRGDTDYGVMTALLEQMERAARIW